MTEWPEPLRARFNGVLPPDRVEVARQLLHAPRRVALRVNTLRFADAAQGRAEVRRALAECGVVTREVEWLPDALVVEEGSLEAIQASEPFSQGLLHVQNLSSIAVAHALAPQPGMRVLDMCAAPGSKASHCAALMRNTGLLTAGDASRARLFRLRAVLQGLGAQATVVMQAAERWGRRAPCGFDAVLADVPCSAEGRALAGDAAAAGNWSLRACKRLASRQKAILHSAIEGCAPGGVVVYSTCTLGPEENEEVLARALERYAERVRLEPLPVQIPAALPGMTSRHGEPFPGELTHARRVTPVPASVHPDGPWLEGFFIARLRRVG